jgi:sirohydrochlorin cobaltochelatase
LKPVVASTAYLLVSHGSRDPRPQEAMNRLASLVRKHLEASPSEIDDGKALQGNRDALSKEYSNADLEDLSVLSAEDRYFLDQNRDQLIAERLPATSNRRPVETNTQAQVIVGTACLELAPVPLSEQIYQFGRRVKAAGVNELKLLPVFLMSGVHVMEDIPKEVEAARALLQGEGLTLTLCPHLGSHTQITEVLANRLASVPAEGSLLVAHGSRRPKGNKAIKGLAQRLGTAVAYWATPPDIETQVITLMQQGCQKLTILPYFLFAGGITDAIVHRTEELAERFPKIKFRLLPTLGATDEIATLAANLLRE